MAVGWVVLLALGNLAASRPVPAVACAPRALATPVRVEKEVLAFACREEDRLPRCDLVATYTLHNPTAEAQAVAAEFLGVRTAGVTVTRDGAPLVQALEPADEERLRERLGAAGAGGLLRRGDVDRTPLRLSLGPGETAAVTVAARMSPGRFFAPSYTLAPSQARHMLLGADVPRSDAFHLEYLVSPIRTWGGEGEARARAPAVAVTLTHPRRWGVTLTSRQGEGLAEMKPEVREDGGTRTLAFTVDAEAVDTFEAALDVPPQLAFNGGLLVGVGGVVTAPAGFRVRLGYEVAVPGWLGWSAAVETGFTGDLLAVLVAEAQTSVVMFVVPSLGAGLGVPLRVLPEPRVGVRVQGSVHWPFVGLVLALDVFPGAPAPVQLGLFAQLGL